MTDQDFHKLYPKEFEEAVATAYGAIMGWCYGNNESPPRLTPTLKGAYERAFAEAFDAGVLVGLEEVR